MSEHRMFCCQTRQHHDQATASATISVGTKDDVLGSNSNSLPSGGGAVLLACGTGDSSGAPSPPPSGAAATPSIETDERGAATEGGSAGQVGASSRVSSCHTASFGA